MTTTLLNGISTILVQAILTILGLAVTYLITVVVSYLNKKKQAEVVSTGVAKYNSMLAFAKGIYFQAEQLFKFIPGAGNLKATMFDKLLLVKFPGLTQTELDHFRESIVGEFNSQVTPLLAPAYDETKDEANSIPIESLSIENKIADQVATV
jgi:phosphoglycerol transferase MdoB-like AlkP superfamily enzyme